MYNEPVVLHKSYQQNCDEASYERGPTYNIFCDGDNLKLFPCEVETARVLLQHSLTTVFGTPSH